MLRFGQIFVDYITQADRLEVTDIHGTLLFLDQCNVGMVNKMRCLLHCANFFVQDETYPLLTDPSSTGRSEQRSCSGLTTYPASC